jgi:hypothetical protein
MAANLEKIAAAVEAAGSRTPSVVLDAFLPEAPEVFGLPLRKFSLGAYLALEKLGHPFVLAANGQQVEISRWDFATALYIMATPSAEVFEAVERGRVKAAICEIADRAELHDFEQGTKILLAHIERGLAPLMPMRSATGSAQKKTAASGGH